MKNKNDQGASAQGANVSQEEAMKKVTLPQVKEFLKRDLNVCLHLLDSVYRDQATLDALAEFLYGRLQNDLHRKDLEKQGKIEL